MKTDNYDNEETRLEGAQNATGSQASDSGDKSKSKSGAWKSAAAGAASGVVIGTLSTTLMGMKSAGDEPGQPADNHKEELSHPEWVDDQVQVATSVSDNMSFGQAFAAARAEVGAGGCFEWHGKLYGTYTAEEWNSMSAEERAEYGDHFSWNHIDHSSGNVAQHSHAAAANHAPAAADDDIEVVSVNHHEAQNVTPGHEYAAEHNTQAPHVSQAGMTEPGSDDGDIEVLGVFHDSDSGANYGALNVDGQDVVLVDVNGDMTFDYMAVDSNHNGEIDEGEVADISDGNLTVADLGGFTNSTDDLLASDNAPDYSSDAVYDV